MARRLGKKGDEQLTDSDDELISNLANIQRQLRKKKRKIRIVNNMESDSEEPVPLSKADTILVCFLFFVFVVELADCGTVRFSVT